MPALEPADPQEEAEEEEESEEEFECDVASCIDIIRGSVLDPRCIRYCKEFMNEAMDYVLQLLTQTPIFVEDRDGFSYKVSTSWRLVVENHGEDVPQPVNFTTSAWSQVVIYFDKNADRMGKSPIVAMWAEKPEGSIYIKHFHETADYVIVEIANPFNVDMETPD